MNRENVERCGKLLAEKGMTIAFAESATAGRAAMEFSLCKDAGKFLKGGLVCYDAGLKEDVLHVSQEVIDAYSPESAEVTFAIAAGLEQLIKADLHIGITGLTSAGGSESVEKPVGTMFFCGLFGENKVFEDRKVFSGSPEAIILAAVDHTAKLLCDFLQRSN